MELRFPLILDGATGTELQKRGYTGDVCAGQWTLDHPDAILATAKHNMATVYIAGRVEIGEYALAIAYSSVLIVIMLICVLLIQRFVGSAQMGRRSASAA